jgi:hypothetical protein
MNIPLAISWQTELIYPRWASPGTSECSRGRTAHAEAEDDQGGPGHERLLAGAGRLRPEAREYDAVEEEGEDHEPPEDSHHDEEAAARTDPLPMSRDRDALPFPVYGRLRMGHRTRGGWSRGVRDGEDRQQTPHGLKSVRQQP